MKLRTRLALTLVALAVPLVAGAVWLRARMSERASIQGLVDYGRMRMNSGGREACEDSPTTFQEPPLPLRPRDLGPERPGAPNRPGQPERFGGPERMEPDRAGSERGVPDRGGDRVGVDRAGVDRSGVDRTGADRAGVDRFDPERPVSPERGEGFGPPRGERRVRPGGGPMGAGARVELWAYGADFLSANPRAPQFPATLRAALESGRREAGIVDDESEVDNTTVAARMGWSEGPCAIVLVRRRDPRAGDGAVIDAVAAGLIALVLLAGVIAAVGPIVRRVRKLEDSVRHSAATNYRASVPVEGTDEVADLAAAFNTAGAAVQSQIEAVEKREKTLRSFVENTTHDVMLPLTVLQGHLTRMRNELARGVSPERDTVREALEESHYMASLVQNLGAAAKLEAGEPGVRTDPFSWNALVERVILRHKTIAAEKGVELDYAVPEEDVRAQGDVTLVEQALSNVVHNAVRYNKPGGHVAVILEAKDGRFFVRAFDDGPGVPEIELARIAERSYRSDEARARHPDGLGLGLSIAKDVAERHGFDLELKRSEAGGLEVEIRGPTPG